MKSRMTARAPSHGSDRRRAPSGRGGVWRAVVPAAALILLLAGALWAAGAPGDAFPQMKGRDLTGARVTTALFRGKAWLVIVGFERNQSEQMELWAKNFRAVFPDKSRADAYEIAALPGSLSFMRGVIDGKMRKGSPEGTRDRIMTVYAADAVSRVLGIRNRKEVHVFLVDPAGNIAQREAGAPTPEVFARVQAVASRLLAAP